MVTEHPKSELTFKDTHNSDKHSEGDLEGKQSFKNFVLKAVWRIADYVVILLFRLVPEEVLSICFMSSDYRVSTSFQQLYKIAFFSIKWTPDCSSCRYVFEYRFYGVSRCEILVLFFCY
jgi:hypothetical protein